MPDIKELKSKVDTINAEIAKVTQAYQTSNSPEDSTKLFDLYKQLNAAQSDVLVEAEKHSDPLSQDIEEAIQRVRKEEKQKLYNQMNSLKTEKEQLEAAVKEKEDALKAAQEAANKKAEDAQGDGNTSGISSEKVNEILDAALAKHAEVAKQQSEQATQEYEERIKALEGQLQKAELQAHRENILKQHGDKLIPELVKGDTLEELNNSAILARQAYERVFKQAGDASAAALQQVRDGVPTPPTTPSSALDKLAESGEMSAEQIKAMSPQEWSEYRKKIGLK